MNIVMTQKLKRYFDESDGCYDFQDIMEGIKSGMLQSFAHGDTWVVTQVGDYPRRKVLHILMVVGEWDDLNVVMPDLMQFAREIGATLITGSGRDEWRLRLHELPGWVCRGSIYSMELNDEPT